MPSNDTLSGVRCGMRLGHLRESEDCPIFNSIGSIRKFPYPLFSPHNALSDNKNQMEDEEAAKGMI